MINPKPDPDEDDLIAEFERSLEAALDDLDRYVADDAPTTEGE